MSCVIRLLVAACLALCSLHTIPAHAEKRVALVIGNSSYRYSGPLANPKNDASDIAVVLKAHAFQVLEGYDLSKAAMEAKLREFARALTTNEAGLFFYAGHGLQVSGVNYLVPVDAKLEDASGLDFELVRLDLVQRTMERETSTNIIFLDACRDNPLARNLARALGTRSVEIGRGLAPTQGGAGTLISFSTQPGNVVDGSGKNSPFTAALTEHLIASKHDLSAILIDVRNDVMKATQDRQVPWEHSALRGRFYFSSASEGAPPAPQLVDPALMRAARDYDLAAKVGTKEAWDAFLAAHPTGFHAELAKVQRAKVVAVQPPSKAGSSAEANKGAQVAALPKIDDPKKVSEKYDMARLIACCLAYCKVMNCNSPPASIGCTAKFEEETIRQARSSPNRRSYGIRDHMRMYYDGAKFHGKTVEACR
jgi:uncharacterized caspase-like protein